MKLTRVSLLTVLCCGALCALTQTAAAQQEPSAEVQIDTSVLQELSPAAGAAGHSRPVLSRPDGTVVPLQQTTQKIIPLSADAPAVNQPYAVRRTNTTPRIMPRQPQAFPVQTSSRSESKNPSAGLTKPAGTSIPPSLIAPRPTPSRQAYQPLPEIEPSAPATPVIAPPPRKTAATPLQKQTTTTAVAKGMAPIPGRKPSAEAVLASDAPPLPKRRPADLNRDIPAFVPAPKNIASASGLPPTKIPAPTPPARRSAALDAGVLSNAPKVMPAIPTNPVGVEELAAIPGIAVAENDDPLLMQLQDFNRDNFVKHVEDVTARTAPVPAKKPQRGGMPPALAKNNVAIVTPNLRVDAETVSPMELAALTPAAGGEKFASRKIDRTPRLPPQEGGHESAFLSVPFMPGDEKATPDIISRLESEVIPLLQKNPGWRIQIQAFSSPDNEVRSSARRTALSRALSVREYLMDKGIEAPRMDIRALGMETDRDPLDRIDLVFFDPAAKS